MEEKIKIILSYARFGILYNYPSKNEKYKKYIEMLEEVKDHLSTTHNSKCTVPQSEIASPKLTS